MTQLQLTAFNHYMHIRYESFDAELFADIKGLATFVKQDGGYGGMSWNNIKCLYQNGMFPTGLWPVLRSHLQDKGVTYEFIDHRQAPVVIQQVRPLCGINYRAYQMECIEIGLKYQRAVFQLPPGMGKTEILIGLAQSIGEKTLWLAPSKNVAEQTKKRWVLRGGHPRQLEVYLPQSLVGKLKHLDSGCWFAQFKILVVDECHHVPADSWYKIAMSCNAPYRFAVSATPETDGDNIELTAAIGPIRYQQTYEFCYAGGHLSRPTVRMLQYFSPGISPPKRHTRKGPIIDWPEAYRIGIAQCERRNQLAVQEALRYYKMGWPPILMTKLVEEHAVPLAKLLDVAGFQGVRVVTGETSLADREAAIEELLAGNAAALVTSCILGEGQDMPRLTALINLTGGNSKIRATQIVGRTMRSDTPSLITDFVDRQHYLLAKHSRIREQVYEQMGAVVEQVVCSTDMIQSLQNE